MTTNQVGAPTPNFAIAGVLLDALAARNFGRLERAFDSDASLSALLPRGACDFASAIEIRSEFERWFGDATEFEVAEASVGQVGALLQLRWRVRVKKVCFGSEPMVVEQHAYAATGPTGLICQMSLLCSGFWKEHVS